MKILTRQDIDETKLGSKSVPVPEWGGDALLRQMSGTEREDWERHCRRRREETEQEIFPFSRATLVARCLVDERGVRLYGDDEVPLLSDKAGSALDLLFDECSSLNRLGPKEEDDVLKNSAAAPSGGSTAN